MAHGYWLRRFAVAFAIAAAAIAVAAMPTAARAVGATQTVDTFTDQPGGFLFFEDPCSGQQVGGYTLDTGWVRTTETPNGTVQTRGHIVSTVDLYVVDVPPWDPSFTGFGPLVGTWTLTTSFAGPMFADGGFVNGFVETGRLVYPDGSSSHLLVHFRMVQPAAGPPKVFFVKAVCEG